MYILLILIFRGFQIFHTTVQFYTIKMMFMAVCPCTMYSLMFFNMMLHKRRIKSYNFVNHEIVRLIERRTAIYSDEQIKIESARKSIYT